MKMKKHDESIAILKGEIQVQQKRIEDLLAVKSQHEKDIAKCDNSIDHYNNRIHNINNTIDDIYALKAKEEATP